MNIIRFLPISVETYIDYMLETSQGELFVQLNSMRGDTAKTDVMCFGPKVMTVLVR